MCLVTSQQTFFALKTSSTHLQRNNFLSSKMSCKDIWKTCWRHLARRLEDVLEDEKLLHWRRLQDFLKTCLEDVLKTCCENVLKTRLEGVLITCLEDVFKMSWRQTKSLLGISVSNKSKCVSNEAIFHKPISDDSKANPKSLIRTQSFQYPSYLKLKQHFCFEN